MATIKDPFKNLPRMEDEPMPGDPGGSPSSEQSDGDPASERTVNASRRIFKSLSKGLVPLAGAGIVAWLLLTDDTPPSMKVVPVKQETEVDRTALESNTSHLLTTLKADAEATTRAKEESVVAPQSAPGSGPVPNPMKGSPVEPGGSFGGALTPEDDKRLRDAQIREEEILASPLEAQGGSFKLLGGNDDPASGGLASGPKARLVQLQGEIEAMKQRRSDADAPNDKTLEMMAKLAGGDQGQTQRKPQNEEFLASHSSADAPVTLLRQQPALARHVVHEGTPIRAALLTGVNSDLPGDVTAIVTSDVHDSVYPNIVLIPKYSKLKGKYNNQILVGQSRILIAMTRLILPNGTWVPLAGARGTDVIGQAGVEADVNNHFWKMFGTSAIIGAASMLLPSNDRNITSSTGATGSTTTGGSIAGMALNETLKTLLERNKMIVPTLTLKPGEEFMFLAAHDMALQPYRP